MGNLVFQMIKKHLAFHGHPRERYCNSWLFMFTLETLAGVLACVDGHPGRQTRAGCHIWLNPAFLEIICRFPSPRLASFGQSLQDQNEKRVRSLN